MKGNGWARAGQRTALLLLLGLAGAAAAEQEPAAPAPVEASQPRGLAAVEAVWRAPAKDLAERVERSRRAALRHGVRNLDAPARALLLDPSLGTPAERARGAVRLAPDLPDAHLALAKVHWSEERDGMEALGELRAAMAAIPKQLDAWLWFRATLSHAILVAATLSGWLFLFAAGLAAVPVAARHLAARLHLPGVAGFALVAALGLVPAALGEGLLGIALVCAGFTLFHAGGAGRVAVFLAAALLLVGVHPLTEITAQDLAALAADPVAEAAHDAERGFPTALARERLEAYAGRDPLADAALALGQRRRGELELANATYSALIAPASAQAELLNNAANARFAAGRNDEAIALYERAIARESSPVVLYNLSRAYGRAIRLGDQDDALRRAQEQDAAMVVELTQDFGELESHVAVDMPLSLATVRTRFQAESDLDAIRKALRRRIAPGALGRSGLLALGLFAALGISAMLLGIHLGAGGPAVAEDDLYAGIARLLQGPEATDPSLRMERLAVLRAQRARYDRVASVASLLLPGAAGVVARRPLLALVCATAFGVALAAARARHGVVPDALAAGETGALLFGVSALLAGSIYLLGTLLAIAMREKA